MRPYLALALPLLVGLTAVAQTAGTPSAASAAQPGTDPTAPAAQMAGLSPNAFLASPPAFVPGLGDTAAAPIQPHVVRISGGVMATSVVTKVDPVFPADARAAHLSGTVVLSARIGKDGHVESLAVVSGPAVFQASAVTAVRQWIYRPYRLNGQPVAVQTVITVNFEQQQPQ